MAFMVMMVMTGCMKNGTNSTVENAKPESATTAAHASAPVDDPRYRMATFAGGCFWCMQPPFDTVAGVIRSTAGYSGGPEADPTYERVSSGTTGHAESVQVVYDPAIVSYEHLLDIYWHNINPTQVNGQFADHGRQYRTAIFYHDEAQHQAALKSKQALAGSGKFDAPIAVEITQFSAFYPAEDYHQQYYKKNYEDYHRYRIGSGREGYLQATWGK